MSTSSNTSSTDSQMHNNIMAAGSKDRPPMLGPGRYSQWRSRFLRYIDTKNNGEGLKKCILNGPYVPTSVLIQAVPAAEGRPAVQQHTTIETVLNMTPENKEHFQSEKEAIFLLLTERLQQGDESLNVHRCKVQSVLGSLEILLLEYGEAMERSTHASTRMVKVVTALASQSEKIDTHLIFTGLFDILKAVSGRSEDFEYVKSLENEVDELESEKADFSNMYDLLIEECVSKDVICSYLHSMSELNAHTELQCMYLHKVQECECLFVHFGNDQFAPILGLVTLNQGNVKRSDRFITSRLYPQSFFRGLVNSGDADFGGVLSGNI
ncbi:hypothetical protein Tco_0616214 [Tanacetum coccineum]